MKQTALLVGSPQEVIDRTLAFREYAGGDYQRQLFNVDGIGVPRKTVLQQIEMLGEVVQVLRKEFAVGRPAHVPDAPTHAARVAAAYGEGPARVAVPNAHRGDNLAGDRPYRDTPAPAGASFGAAATRTGA